MKKTFRAFSQEERTASSPGVPPVGVHPGDPPGNGTITPPAKVHYLADQFQVPPQAVTIQHKARKSGTSCTYYQVVLEYETGSVTLAITLDLLQLYLVEWEPGEGLSTATLSTLLASRGLRCAENLLHQALLQPPPLSRKVKIAQGQAPRHGQDQQISYLFFPDADYQDQVSPFFAFLATGQLAHIPPETRAIWVSPGQVLARLEPASPGEEGRDVFGNPLPAFDGNLLGEITGPGVGLSEDGTILQATTPGYVYLHQHRLGICDPLILAGDGFSACFAYIPGWTSHSPSPGELQDFLQERGVRRGIDSEACNQVAQSFARHSLTPHLFPLAQGRPPQPGQDGEILFDVDCSRKPGRINPDGSIDFKETCFGLDVPAGIRLARLCPATPGEPGFTILGEDLPAAAGAPRQLVAGAHVEVVEEGRDLVFRATIDGRVSFQREVLQVHEGLQIPADVDFQSGNVDFPGDVVIAGSVLPGFSVKARGSIAVRGQVEAGARLEAGGDIVVSGGVVGAGTRVVARGSVTVKFVQDATLRTGGDLTVGSYIFNADVRSEGQVLVNQGTGRRSGTISGGQVVAARGIRARFAGSPSGTATQLVVGVDPTIEESLRRCQRQLDRCETRREHLRRLLGLEEVTLPRLKHLLACTPPSKREQVADFIRQWQKLDKTIRAIRARRVDLRQDLTTPAPQALLAVDQIIYPGVKLQLGEHKAEVQLEWKETQLTSATWSAKLLLQPAA